MLNFLSDVLEDYCNKHDLPFISADDLLYSNETSEGKTLSSNNKRWLEHYISVWDIIQREDI